MSSSSVGEEPRICQVFGTWQIIDFASSLVRRVSVRYKIVRGALDFGGVVNRQSARSRYGGKSDADKLPLSRLIHYHPLSKKTKEMTVFNQNICRTDPTLQSINITIHPSRLNIRNRSAIVPSIFHFPATLPPEPWSSEPSSQSHNSRPNTTHLVLICSVSCRSQVSAWKPICVHLHAKPQRRCRYQTTSCRQMEPSCGTKQ